MRFNCLTIFGKVLDLANFIYLKNHLDFILIKDT